MRLFQKILWTIAAVIFLQVLVRVLDAKSPLSFYFHQSLLSSLQAAIIIWLVIAIILHIIFRKKKQVKTGWWSAAATIVLITCFELLSLNWMNNPSSIPSFLRTGYIWYYAHNDSHIIQIVPECSEYDSAFFYNLKTNNKCKFTNREFSNLFTTNSKGFRDDEKSLTAPEIICLGDSYMLGWGINQDETIPSQLEKLTGKNVLNAGMSSFGTAREMKRLNVIDTSALKYIIIQYCANDNEENKAFFDNGNKLKISSKASYDSLGRRDAWNKKYFPGKVFLTSLKYLSKETIKSILGKPPSVIGLPIEPERDARMFVDMLKSSNINFNKTKVIVFAGDGLEFINNNAFLNEVKKLSTTSGYSEHFASNLILEDLSGVLSKDDYYILDGHFRASAHQKIAVRLATLLK
jgi:hypothetical protein